MNTPAPKTSVKIIGANGQISLGKEFAGRQVLIETREPGVWLIRTARVVPENELWLHETKANGDLHRALQWAQSNPPAASGPDATIRNLDRGGKKSRKSRSA